MLTVSQGWKDRFPGAVVGVLTVNGVTNPKSHAGLDARKRELEDAIRSKYAGMERAELRELERMTVYASYYKKHKKSYHVLLQLESVLQGKPIPSISGLVEANFMAELKNHLLTAAHDGDSLEQPITLDVSTGTEEFMQMTGNRQVLREGDMVISDAQGVMSCIIYGPDRRTKVTPETRNVVYTTYSPAGIGESAVRDHLTDIKENILLFAPNAQVQQLDTYEAG
jgi:DNA/RNA-binding domain of Phe-tRNA-synthetase-like protein